MILPDLFLLRRIHPHPTMSDEVFCEELDKKIESLQGLRVLIADDDTDTCLSISSMLIEIGMRSEWTVSGKEAVIRAKHAVDMGDEFFAYIIDWLMPDMNGIETVRRIRRVIGDNSPIIIAKRFRLLR